MASFKDAFRAARNAQGAGGTFTWNGKTYTTDMADEKKKSGPTKSDKPKVRPYSGPTASDKPKTRPASLTTTATGKEKQAAKEVKTADTVASNIAKNKRIADARANLAESVRRSEVTRGAQELMTGRKGAAAFYKSGGVVKMKEGSAKDTREDKSLAKKSGMSMKKWEKSAADKKHDAPGKMNSGGVVKKATGGSMRGTGAATRGKGFSGCY